jgi:type II secretory pathway pseudopilin PulG
MMSAPAASSVHMKMTVNNLRRRSGVSLIEILVVLVLLLIGILSVVRLFPPGFLINKEVAEMTAASRLVKQEMDFYANNSISLMDDIVPITPIPSGGGYVFRVDTNATPDDVSQADENTYGVWAPYFSDVNKARRIIAESVRIPLPTSTSLGRGSVYMLSSGPFMDVSWDGQNRSLFIYGAPLNRRYAYDGDQAPNGIIGNLGPSSYAIDYPGKQMMFAPAPYDRQFLLNISYYNTSGQLSQLIDIPVDVPRDMYDWVPIPAASLPADFRSFAAFTDTCARKFQDRTGVFTAWSKVDPYEYYLDPNQSPRIGAANGIQANVGVIVFNPLGRDWTEYTSTGPRPLTARIDYDVLDWHIIREDRPLPTSTPYQVSLSLSGLKKLGDIEDDQTQYADLFSGIQRTGNGQFGNPVDVMVYNASNGTYVDPSNYTVSYKDGTVTFADTFGNANASATMRFFYRAHGDWALQIQKAAASYRQTLGFPSFAEFYIGGTGTVTGGSATRIYFPLSEAGKTVSIREYWYRNSNGTQRVGNETFRINANRTLFQTLQNGAATQVCTWIDIASSDKHPDAISFDASSTGYAALGVQGLSFRSRVLWKSGSTVTSTANGNVVNTRWRHSDLDTILTRSTQ